MKKPNYAFERRQRELAKQTKKEQKKLERQQKKDQPGSATDESTPG